MEGRTTIIVAHRLSTVMNADVVVSAVITCNLSPRGVGGWVD
jgi:ABC-type transport system involved in Fe-S cluster assembly fused permease/ATPase subunit